MKLVKAGWEAVVLPEMGGSIAALRHDGREVLRNMPAGATSPLDASCFPLVPYCNRIRNARFDWQGRAVQLPQNFAPETSSLHGLGWEQGWEVAQEAGSECALVHNHDGSGGWPWPYRAEQRISLGEKGCAISLTLTNLGDTPMPAGLGLHPYFRRRPEARVSFASKGVLMVDEALIPNGVLAPQGHFGDWQAGSGLPEFTVDHCYSGWSGSATISDDLGAITLTASGAPFLHLYAPQDGSALCLEPVSHAPDALNADPAGMTVLAPGGSAAMHLLISEDS